MRTEIEELKKKHEGEWIAISKGKVIAASKDYHELHKMLKKGKEKTVSVVHSPGKKEKKYGFLLIIYEV